MKSMLKRRTTQISLSIGLSVTALLLGVFLPELSRNSSNSYNSIEEGLGSPSEFDVTTLVSMLPEQRTTQLQTAIDKSKNLNRDRD